MMVIIENYEDRPHDCFQQIGKLTSHFNLKMKVMYLSMHLISKPKKCAIELMVVDALVMGLMIRSINVKVVENYNHFYFHFKSLFHNNY